MADGLDSYRKIGGKIEIFIRPATFPLAVKLIPYGEEIEPSFKRPSRDMNLQNFVCQDFKMSRSYGWTIAVAEEDINCKLARAVYGWDKLTDETVEWMNQFNIGLYAKDQKTGEKMSAHLYFLENKYQGLVISPLTRTRVVPDVVLIYCLPAQAMRLIQGYLYMEGGVLEFTSAGRVGSCHEGVAKTLITGNPQLVVLGNGDRIWGGAQDWEVMFSCPRNKLDALVEGLEATHAAGLRYPIPSYMNYSPGFQEDFEKAAIKRAGGTLAKADINKHL